MQGMSTTLHDRLRERKLTLADLARGLDLNKSTVTRWAQKRVPAERVIEVERLTGLSRHSLRPDIYGPPPREGATA